MPLYTQEGRLISLTTPLGDDKFLLTGFSGHEAISRLSSFHLTALSEDKAIDFASIIGASVTINITQQDDSKRCIHGIVSQFVCTGVESDMAQYELEVVPALWKLTRYADCRIFHNASVSDIIATILDDRSIQFTSNLTGDDVHKPLEYCVQYRETDFNFISRLMEQYGIFYFFQDDDVNGHYLVLANSSSAIQQCPGTGKAGYNLATGGLDSGDTVNQFIIGQELRSGKYTHTDYNFTTSQASLLASESTIYTAGGNDTMEIFDYPGLHGVQSDGAKTAKIRMQEEEAQHKIARGSGVCRSFVTGYKFDLEDHPIDSMNKSYLLTEIHHVASVSSTYGETDSPVSDSYSNSFVCIPSDVVFRPARLTPKPSVQGPQTAIVVGKSADKDAANRQGSGGDGEEIWVDKWGRVLVQFPWDRKKAASCWVRVSQDWAGAGWGMINIPRVGQEVIVSFLEGDPDRPIITGRVYNDKQTVPYTLPDYGTRTTFRTSSSTGGGTDHYNELRFEDKTGKEQVFVRAELDQDNYVKHDSREWIGNNRSLIVTQDQMEKVGGDLHLQVAGKQNEKITGDWNNDVGGNLYEKSGQVFAHEAGQTIHLKAGATMILEAAARLTLKVGGSFVDINPGMVTVVGDLVMINSGGSAGSGPGSSPTAPKDPDKADDGSKGTKMN